jgi:hypothetical protein
MKTNQYYLEKHLTPPVYKRFITACYRQKSEADLNRVPVYDDSLSSVIDQCLLWDETDEGEQYWINLYNYHEFTDLGD